MGQGDARGMAGRRHAEERLGQARLAGTRRLVWPGQGGARALPRIQRRQHAHLQDRAAQRLARSALAVHQHPIAVQDKVSEAPLAGGRRWRGGRAGAAGSGSGAATGGADGGGQLLLLLLLRLLLLLQALLLRDAVVQRRLLQLRRDSGHGCGTARRMCNAAEHAWLPDGRQGSRGLGIDGIKLGQV